MGCEMSHDQMAIPAAINSRCRMIIRKLGKMCQVWQVKLSTGIILYQRKSEPDRCLLQAHQNYTSCPTTAVGMRYEPHTFQPN